MAEECRVVVLTCGEMRRLPIGETVERGYSNGFCSVLFASPPRCVMTKATRIKYGTRCDYSEEHLTNNVVIRETCDGSEKIYVYPKKVYELVKKLYILPIAEGRSPYSNGLLLAGAPGTGKTAMAKIISRMLGIEPTIVRPDAILSKYVGESEKNIRKIFTTAKRNLPSVIIFDDSDVFLGARTLASLHSSEQYMRNIQQIIFEEMQSISDSKIPLLVIATTNVKTSEIDQAFLRGGRFGDPIYIPLPDEEAVYVVLRGILPEQEARALARKLVNAGLSMADAIDYAIKRRVWELRRSHLELGEDTAEYQWTWLRTSTERYRST
jgi:ATPases of the AAA+ class